MDYRGKREILSSAQLNLTRDDRSFVVTISGPAGAGKTTLINNLALHLRDASILHFDSYRSVARWWPNYLALGMSPEQAARQWLQDGADPNEYVTVPRMVEDLRALLSGMSISTPEDWPIGTQHVKPARYILVEDPWSRMRDELAPFINFAVYVDTPLDYALCRRLLRDHESGLDVVAVISKYVEVRERDYYERHLRLRDHADFVVDGMLAPEEMGLIVTRQVREAAGEVM